jgi:hypothetical protein
MLNQRKEIQMHCAAKQRVCSLDFIVRIHRVFLSDQLALYLRLSWWLREEGAPLIQEGAQRKHHPLENFAVLHFHTSPNLRKVILSTKSQLLSTFLKEKAIYSFRFTRQSAPPRRPAQAALSREAKKYSTRPQQ